MASIQRANLDVLAGRVLDIPFTHRQRGDRRLATISPGDPKVIALATIEGLADGVVRARMPTR